ncbi:molybdate ABC transporter substrate-binding protein [Texcoconibacillus texcoconensis]|uniref:Molybdate transport system substrate-binding protein n=1 Tax=Texcoconibacillus texcoconensis TaxID=1095777 RepID=A0A840QQ57_9BACI|nr:molybdate ABC transporter substrate-binding protein [Texcoconibacillus texcoconensis]MBB5173471.1 molybdate transport system substrate-binding protein [Texcoconibacillus texcoconensis]
MIIKKKIMYGMLATCLAMTLVACQGGTDDNKRTLNVSAASSLMVPLQEAKREFEANHPDVELILNFASSGNLREQITRGAPTDIFLSASVRDVDMIDEEGLVDDRYALYENDLVVVMNASRAFELNDIDDLTTSSFDQIAIGNPITVPAGRYAKQSLKNQGVWADLEDRLLLAGNVRQALTYVETNNVEAAIVYETDALAAESVEIVHEIDRSSFDSIIYPAAVLKRAENQDIVDQFIEWIQQQEGRVLFENAGFQSLND